MDDLDQDILDALIIVTRAAAREKKTAVTLDAALREAQAGLQRMTMIAGEAQHELDRMRSENRRFRALIDGRTAEEVAKMEAFEKAASITERDPSSVAVRKADSLDEIDRHEKERNGGYQFQGTASLTEAELAERQGIAVRDPARDCSGG